MVVRVCVNIGLLVLREHSQCLHLHENNKELFIHHTENGEKHKHTAQLGSNQEEHPSEREQQIKTTVHLIRSSH